MCKDLRKVYQSANREQAVLALEDFEKKWGERGERIAELFRNDPAKRACRALRRVPCRVHQYGELFGNDQFIQSPLQGSKGEGSAEQGTCHAQGDGKTEGKEEIRGGTGQGEGEPHPAVSQLLQKINQIQLQI